MTVWSPEVTEQLKALWKAGKSSGEIASILGVGRNAVVAKVARLRKADGGPETRRRGSNLVNSIRSKRSHRLSSAPGSPPLAPELEEPVLEATPVLFAARRFGRECAFPLWGERLPPLGQAFVCGAVISSAGEASNTHYCDRHLLLVHGTRREESA